MTVSFAERSRWSEAPTGWRRALIVAAMTLAFPVLGAFAVLALAAAVLVRLVDHLLERAHHRSRRRACRAHT